MKVVCIIQARLRSTRLPAKILLPLPTGRTVLEEVVYRCKQATRVHQVVVCSPDSEDCDILRPYTGGALWVRGSEEDVLDRYLRAAEISGADIIVRVTSDCPLMPAQMIDAVVLRRNVHALSYCCNNMPRSWPIGYDVECFTMNALRWHAANSWDASSREHVTTALRSSVEGARHVNEPCPYGDMTNLRWTLDDISDYVTITKVFDGALGADDVLSAVMAR